MQAIPSRTRDDREEDEDPAREGLESLGIPALIDAALLARQGAALMSELAAEIGFQEEPLQGRMKEATGQSLNNMRIIRGVFGDLYDVEVLKGGAAGRVTKKGQGVGRRMRRIFWR